MLNLFKINTKKITSDKKITNYKLFGKYKYDKGEINFLKIK